MTKSSLYIAITSLFVGLVTLSFIHSVICVVLYVTGLGLLKVLKQNKVGLKAFSVTYFFYTLYILIQYLYMAYRGFDHLQSFDGINVYIPYTQELIADKLSLFALCKEIYMTSKYAFVGSILIPFVYVGKFSTAFSGDLYVALMQVIVFFSALAIPVIYNILSLFKITSKQAYKYTLIFAFCSIHFYMSGYLVRDMPITLGYYLLIYLTLTAFKLKTILYMLVIIALVMTIRLSSGIFALSFLIIYLFHNLKSASKNARIFAGLLLVISSVLIVFQVSKINDIASAKQTSYLAKQNEAQGGDSTVAAFNSLPPVVSHLGKTVYNQLMPIPSWRTMIETSYRPESYNIMNFLIIPATFFQFTVLMLLILGIWKKKFVGLNRLVILKYLLIVSLLFLMLQSNTLGHRRMMGVYPVFYVLAIMSFQQFSKNSKKNIKIIIVSLFVFLQVLGAFYIL